ncbi:MAG: efflux RND transporter periplasmic adaptor subunit [Candidatus Stygibacter australis]|nr:efflux RND transporter periplasmic adaptor subunit [Candidatus Stygibacter australis]MDP8321100.1 efflux RND transporter periplasmic adaptor subunit [Candidatus Stygibacter australis]
MKKYNLKILILALTMIIFFTGCGKGRPGATKSNVNKVEKAVPVMVQTLELADLDEFVSFTAMLEGITDIYLTSESSGKVLSLNKKLGDWVKKGETIGKIENDSYLNNLDQANASLLSAEAAVELANMQYESTKKLYEAEKVSRGTYISAESSLKQAQAGYASAQAMLKHNELAVKNAQFTAPVSGYISDLKLEVGSYIGMGQQVCRIVDNSRLVIKTGMGEKDISGIKTGQKVYINSDYYDSEIEGKISGIGIAPINGSVNYPVEIELDNPGKTLLPGMVVTGKIQRASYKQVLYTSINNLTQVYDKYMVYVINKDNRAEQRYIEPGKKIERNVILASGVKPGELLVVEGANSLNNNTLVEIKK